MKPCAVLLLVVILAASGTVCSASRAARAECDPLALRPCVPVILWGDQPSTACCAKLRKQRRCLCKYAKNPFVGRRRRAAAGAGKPPAAGTLRESLAARDPSSRRENAHLPPSF
ncbi:hypothetical protein QYE76_054677 [Lolium multiflorum]|uniref:Bifunctional inhibitor/plant lipid transfer protein/seed storage helical domain-containing protein n=1 Tax=Lolium multiflorum TaxID=4521 RepID=A0AAD8WN48_LOLMU|nr:hypothetical protein QYE76_054677 [Lolium multiflorum]